MAPLIPDIGNADPKHPYRLEAIGSGSSFAYASFPAADISRNRIIGRYHIEGYRKGRNALILHCHYLSRASLISDTDVMFDPEYIGPGFKGFTSSGSERADHIGHHHFLVHNECIRIAIASFKSNKHVRSKAQLYLALENQYWESHPVEGLTKWPHGYYGASVLQEHGWCRHLPGIKASVSPRTSTILTLNPPSSTPRHC